MLMLAIGLIALTKQSVAQSDQLTSKTATKEKGYTVLNHKRGNNYLSF